MDGVEFCLLAQTLHPLPVSIKSDGMKFCFLAQAIHPLPASLKSDGMTDMKCVNGLHLQSELAVSDGDFRAEEPK